MLPAEYEDFIAALDASDCAAELDRDYDSDEQEDAMDEFYSRFGDMLQVAQWDSPALIAVMKEHIHDWTECKLCTILDEHLESLFERLFIAFRSSITPEVLYFMSENLDSSREVSWPDTTNYVLQFDFAMHPLATKQMVIDSAWRWAEVESASLSEEENNPTSRSEYLELIRTVARHPSADKQIVSDWLKSVHETLPNAEHLGCNYEPAEVCSNCSEILALSFPK